jgi:hypothetical protein
MRKQTFRAVLSIAFVLAVIARAQAGEEKLSPEQLPKAVLDAAKAKFPDAKIIGASKEDENGKTEYEVVMEKEGHHIDASFTATGSIIAIEKTITAKELPKPVRQAIKKRYPKSSFKRIEEITKGDKLTAYEALLTTADKKTVEVVFDPDAKFVKEEVKKESETKEKDEK